MKNRVYQLDLFRFIAALAVVLYHYTYRLYYKSPSVSYQFEEIESISKYGFMGVDFFFIISGFVIFLSVKHGSLKQFLGSRISRLYPAYWLAVILTSIIFIVFSNPEYTVSIVQFFANLTMFHRYMGIESVDGVYWSLMIEMIFYFFIGLLLFFKQLKNIEYYVIGWLVISILSKFLNPDLLVVKILNFILITKYSAHFIAGILFYLIYSGRSSLLHLILLIFCYFLSVFNTLEVTNNLEKRDGVPFDDLTVYILVGVMYVLFFLVSTDKLKFANNKRFLVLGAITYPLYLLHQNIGYLFIESFSTSSNKYFVLLSIVLVSIFIAYLVSTFWETPISRWIKKRYNYYFIK